jgi:hypothetical protein
MEAKRLDNLKTQRFAQLRSRATDWLAEIKRNRPAPKLPDFEDLLGSGVGVQTTSNIVTSRSPKVGDSTHINKYTGLTTSKADVSFNFDDSRLHLDDSVGGYDDSLFLDSFDEDVHAYS